MFSEVFWIVLLSVFVPSVVSESPGGGWGWLPPLLSRFIVFSGCALPCLNVLVFIILGTTLYNYIATYLQYINIRGGVIASAAFRWPKVSLGVIQEAWLMTAVVPPPPPPHLTLPPPLLQTGISVTFPLRGDHMRYVNLRGNTLRENRQLRLDDHL